MILGWVGLAKLKLLHFFVFILQFPWWVYGTSCWFVLDLLLHIGRLTYSGGGHNWAEEEAAFLPPSTKLGICLFTTPPPTMGKHQTITKESTDLFISWEIIYDDWFRLNSLKWKIIKNVWYEGIFIQSIY